MMRTQAGGRLPLADVLRDMYQRASATPETPSALYLVRLTEDVGLSLALAVHRATGGPDPAVLRDRARRAGISEPMIARAAPVEALALALEGLAAMDERERHLVAWSVRELHHVGEVPVVMLHDGTAIVTSLAAFPSPRDDAEPFGWSLPAVGEA
jgi:hypothetical protein